MDEPKSFLPAVVDAGRVIKHRRPRRMAQLTESERRIAATWARLVGFTERKHVDYVMLESEVERRYGIKVTQPELKFLSTSPRFRRYLTRMVTSSREVVRERLLESAPDAVEDLIWARETAKAEGDYKETRLASGQHLDLIGAAEKSVPGTVNVVTVVLRGRNFDADSMDKALPGIEVTEVKVTDTPDLSAG